MLSVWCSRRNAFLWAKYLGVKAASMGPSLRWYLAELNEFYIGSILTLVGRLLSSQLTDVTGRWTLVSCNENISRIPQYCGRHNKSNATGLHSAECQTQDSHCEYSIHQINFESLILKKAFH